MLAALHGALRKHHGTGARAFLAHLAEARRGDTAGLLATLAGMRDRFAAALPANADVQVRHVARAFALAATAGEMATRWGVLPWPAGEASRAALAVMATWMDRRGGADAGEDGAALVRLRAFIAAHGASRFETLEASFATGEPVPVDQRTINRAGWRARKEVSVISRLPCGTRRRSADLRGCWAARMSVAALIPAPLTADSMVMLVRCRSVIRFA